MQFWSTLRFQWHAVQHGEPAEMSAASINAIQCVSWCCVFADCADTAVTRVVSSGHVNIQINILTKVSMCSRPHQFAN